MKNTRLYTFAVLFDRQLTPKRNLVYMKSRDNLATSDVKLSSRISLKFGHFQEVCISFKNISRHYYSVKCYLKSFKFHAKISNFEVQFQAFEVLF